MRAKRSLGQHFLTDPNLQRKVAGALHAGAMDEVLEIGPGRGALTRHMAGLFKRLVLLEKDDDLARALREEYGSHPEVIVVRDDILKVDLESLVSDRSRLFAIGNIPYNITTPIIFTLLRRPRPREILLTVQREVGERILADPGGRQYGALTVGVQSVATVERVLALPRGAFRPIPAVDSVVLRIRPFDPPPLAPEEESRLRDLTRVAFQWRRKQFRTILRKHPAYALAPGRLWRIEEELGVDLTRRPQTFSPGDFLRLSRALAE